MNILIYRTSSIGDVVLSTAMLAAFIKDYPDIQVHFLTREPQLSLLRTTFPQVCFYEIPKSISFSFAQNLIKTIPKPALVVDLQGNIRSKLLCSSIAFFSKAPVVHAQKNSPHRLKLIRDAQGYKDRVQTCADDVIKPRELQFNLMLRALEIGLKKVKKPISRPLVGNFFPTLELPSNIEGEESIFLKEVSQTGSLWVAIAPGAAHHTKRAPVSLWVEVVNLIQQLKGSLNISLVFMGNDEDRSISNQIISKSDWSGYHLNAAGRCSLLQSARILSKAKFLISNDSALAHIGEAVGIPALVLFGPTAEGFGFAPWRRESLAISSKLSCRPCSKHGKTPCRFGDQLCFTSIDLGVLNKKMQALLALPNQASSS